MICRVDPQEAELQKLGIENDEPEENQYFTKGFVSEGTLCNCLFAYRVFDEDLKCDTIRLQLNDEHNLYIKYTQEIWDELREQLM